jgi:hypothetical protein
LDGGGGVEGKERGGDNTQSKIVTSSARKGPPSSTGYSTPFHTGKDQLFVRRYPGFSEKKKQVTYNMKLRHVLTLLCLSLSLSDFFFDIYFLF